jgi:hypothetical protein
MHILGKIKLKSGIFFDFKQSFKYFKQSFLFLLILYFNNKNRELKINFIYI